MSAGQDALDQLDERVRLLGSTLVGLGWDVACHQCADALPDARARMASGVRMTGTLANKGLDRVDEALMRCGPAAAQASELSARLADLADHPALGVGEARAALAEAAAVLQQQAAECQAHAAVLSRIMMAQDFQALTDPAIEKVLQIIGHTEQRRRQLLAQSPGTASPALPCAPQLGPPVPEKAVAPDGVNALTASRGC